jgi:hypothetical protein
VTPVGEPGDVAGLDQEPGGARRVDSVQVHQRGPGRHDRRGQLLIRGLLALVDAFQVGDQLGGDPAAGLPGRVPRPDPGQQRLGLGRGQGLLGPARDQVGQQLVELADHPDMVLTHGPAPVGQHPQDLQLGIAGDRAQPFAPGGGPARSRARHY